MMKLSERIRDYTLGWRRGRDEIVAYVPMRKWATEVAQLESQNASLLDMLNNLARWVGKGIADGAYSGCANPERAMVDLERATEAIRKAKGGK